MIKEIDSLSSGKGFDGEEFDNSKRNNNNNNHNKNDKNDEKNPHRSSTKVTNIPVQFVEQKGFEASIDHRSLVITLHSAHCIVSCIDLHFSCGLHGILHVFLFVAPLISGKLHITNVFDRAINQVKPFKMHSLELDYFVNHLYAVNSFVKCCDSSFTNVFFAQSKVKSKWSSGLEREREKRSDYLNIEDNKNSTLN